jgi:hypothetical protein|uniref:IPT/TIG domain-containing protein n=1 Tax=viral metagenome TaxID=1070528 RepID=A0A6C0ARB3_9ZZZZ
MSCAKNTSVTNETHSITVNPQFFQNITKNSRQYLNSSCRKISNAYPSFTPAIYSLSVTTSESDVYSLVYVDGNNFLPSVYGTTYVNFGNYKNLPITFYSPNQLSFVVPLNVLIGLYNVTVVNVYNSNFSPAVNLTYAGNLNYSNSITYTIT